MSQPHPYLSLHLPPNTPFELKPSLGNGWGAFATRPIPLGALILREAPLFVIPKHHTEITETDTQAAVQQLPLHEKQQFLHLRYNGGHPFTRLTHACAENSFALPNANGPTYYGVFVLLSRLNHSCVPNSNIPDTDVESGKIACFATRDIAVGEEITFCYNDDFACRTRQERHRALRFTCVCSACQASASEQQLSDLRRRLMRGLHYLTHGEDTVIEPGPVAVEPIIADVRLRKAAENFNTPLSARFVHTLLIMHLLEEEGLMDYFMVARMGPGIEQTASLFETESNARIARLAMAQETWLGKLGVAARLYDRKDANDAMVTAGLRMLHGLPEMR
ncbi:hypothetical protein V500_01900 [Pseudogymnoascus sp. VKM F-4518 (FW-2643)]|nr:hypothetical protein V500_01900 [Pseudogymnoascus sp. VKM F-4518 (FW-2643)]